VLAEGDFVNFFRSDAGLDIDVWDSVTSRHDVGDVDVFGERFDTGATQDALFTHRFGHVARAALQTCNEDVWERTFRVLFKCADDDRLFTSITPR